MGSGCTKSKDAAGGNANSTNVANVSDEKPTMPAVLQSHAIHQSMDTKTHGNMPQDVRHSLATTERGHMSEKFHQDIVHSKVEVMEGHQAPHHTHDEKDLAHLEDVPEASSPENNSARPYDAADVNNSALETGVLSDTICQGDSFQKESDINVKQEVSGIEEALPLDNSGEETEVLELETNDQSDNEVKEKMAYDENVEDRGEAEETKGSGNDEEGGDDPVSCEVVDIENNDERADIKGDE